MTPAPQEARESQGPGLLHTLAPHNCPNRMIRHALSFIVGLAYSSSYLSGPHQAVIIPLRRTPFSSLSSGGWTAGWRQPGSPLGRLSDRHQPRHCRVITVERLPPYGERKNGRNPLILLAPPPRLERGTPRSTSRMRLNEIRTHFHLSRFVRVTGKERDAPVVETG
jgi:hypothetical protein